MQSVSLGRVTIISDPSIGLARSQVAGRAAIAGRPFAIRRLSLEEAKRTAGGGLVQPDSRLQGQLRLDRVEQAVAPDAAQQVVATALVYRSGSSRWVVIQQQSVNDAPTLTTPADVEKISVAGRPAALFAVSGSSGRVSVGEHKLVSLMVEVRDLLVTVQGVNLPREEAIRIAESLQ